MRKELPQIEKIKKISVADEDVLVWIKTLKAGGLSNEEIDAVMSKVNKIYRQKKGFILVDEELEEIKAEYRKKYHQEMPPEMVEYFKRGLELRLAEKNRAK